MALDPKVWNEKCMADAPFALRYKGEEPLPDWQEKARAKLAELTGYEGTPVDPCFRIEETIENEDSTEYRFMFETEPEVTAIGQLVVPRGAEGKLPLIICLQGHSKGMHISLGHPKYEGDEATIHGGDRDFARQIVARGQIALALEQRGFGERGGDETGPKCTQPAVQAMLVGKTLIGQRCWDISRAIDVVLANFPQVDADKIAIMGNSGGGTATIYAAALDTRIAAAMPSCAFCGYMPSIGVQHHCLCNYVPGIMNWFDMGDLGALIAPRPFVVVNGTKDGIFPLFSAKEQFEIAAKAYEAAGAPGKIRHVIGPEGHRFYADMSWPVFDELTGWK